MLLLLLGLVAHAGETPYDEPLLGAPSATPASEADPFHWTVQAPTLAPGGAGRVELTLHVPAGYVVYRDQLEVDVIDDGGLVVGEVDLPPGLVKPDPASGADERALFDMDVVVYVPVSAPTDHQGTATLKLQLRHQGCKGGLCYSPTVTDQLVGVPVGPPQEG